jgi:electron transport complex protein RnfG
MKNINWKEIKQLGIVLGVISMMAAILLATTYSVTKPIIEEQKAKAILEAQKSVFPDADLFEPFLDPATKKTIENVTMGSTVLQSFTEAKTKTGETLGYIANVLTPGYSGNIVFVIGFTKDHQIKKIQITEQTETPGLGANTAKSSFLDQFINKKVTDPFEVKGDVKAVTAATISSRAVTNGIKNLIKFMFEPGKGVLP